ncbi:MAG: hypothetical protein ACRD0L_17240 [Acidimicrobiales bacterium]
MATIESHRIRVVAALAAEGAVPLRSTLALAAGVPTRVLSDRLGHSAMAVTTDIYQHAIPDLEADFAERIGLPRGASYRC